MSDPTEYTVGYGSKIYYSTDGTTYTLIANSIDLKSPEPEVGDIKVTNNQSPDNTHEYGPGMIEPGTIDFEVIYGATQAAALYALLGTGTIYHWIEYYVDASGWKFDGYLKKFGIETKTEDDANKNTIGIKVTAKPAFTSDWSGITFSDA